jgi:predicted peroxiredoxin
MSWGSSGPGLDADAPEPPGMPPPRTCESAPSADRGAGNAVVLRYPASLSQSYRLLTTREPEAGTGPVAPDESEAGMAGKAVISLSTGLEDPEKVTVAFLVAVGAAESGRPTLMFQAKEAVRLALEGTAAGVACDGCPSLPDLLARYEKAGGRYMVCPVCFNAKKLDKGGLLPGAELAGSVQLWEWIGDDTATTFSY